MAKATQTRQTTEAPVDTETKRERFERIGQPRVNRALHAIKLIGNLASSNYEWDEADVEAMRAALQDQVDKTLFLFERRKETEQEFSFPTGGTSH